MVDMPGYPTYSGGPVVAGSTMSRAGFRPELFVPGLRQVFGMGVESVEDRLALAFHIMNSQRAFEEMLSMAGIGYFERREEGQPIRYQSIESRYKSRFYHLDYVSGLRFTKKVKRDMLFNQISEATTQFGMSAQATKATLGWNFFNTGSTVTWNDEEGQNFFSEAHPLSARAVGSASTYSNWIKASPDFETIQEGIVLLENTPNDMGYPMHMKAQYLFHHPEDRFIVKEYLQSPGRYNTPNNIINSLSGEVTPVPCEYMSKNMMLLRGNVYRTYWFDREPLETASEEDFDTDDTKFKATFSCSNGAADWRGWVLISLT
ncbi:MAG: hypothetical protein ACYDCO_01775 [Armatimonadota bacterium]